MILDSLRGHANNPWRHGGSAVRCELMTLLREDNIQRGLDDLKKFVIEAEGADSEDDVWRQQAEKEKLH